MIKIVTDVRDAKFITHRGTMHADEVFATAFLSLLYDEILLMRVVDLDFSSIREDAIIYDIGKGKYDHHQLDAEIRDNGIKYSSFGLLWKDFGKKLLEKMCVEQIEEIFVYFDKDFVEAIDAIDNGDFPEIEACYRLKTISDVIKLFNPSYASGESEDDQFLKAVFLAVEILKQELSNIIGKMKAKKVIHQLLEETTSNVLVLDEYVPYEETILLEDKEQKILFVVFPSNRGGYAAKTLPKSLKDRSDRRLFKRKWAGLSGEEFQRVSNVKTAKFCHVNRFIVTADTKEDILLLVEQCL